MFLVKIRPPEQIFVEKNPSRPSLPSKFHDRTPKNKGAGRPTGGPGFNILFEYHLNTHPATKNSKKDIAPFADDSEIKVKREAEAIAAYIKSFEDASKFGLQVHRTGKKGPTLLVRGGLEEETEAMLRSANLQDIKVISEAKFLGLMLHICPVNRVIVARFPSDIISKLTYFVMELGRNFRVLQQSCNDVVTAFKSLSNAVASLVESRIQYAIAFLDRGSICQAMVIHKRALCSLTGCSFRFFGFKNMQPKETEDRSAVNDLYAFLESLESTTYVKLCMVLGRPTMKQMALRACNVIYEQADFAELKTYSSSDGRLRAREPKFTQKIDKYLYQCRMEDITNESPRLNDFHQEYTKLKSFQLRKRYIKACTDNLLLHHLEAKGWIRDDMHCRFESCSELKESLEHVVNEHGRGQLTRVYELKKLISLEQKRGTKRPCLAMSSTCAREFAELFSDVPEPWLRLKLNAERVGNERKRRRLNNSARNPHPPPSSDQTNPRMTPIPGIPDKQRQRRDLGGGYTNLDRNDRYAARAQIRERDESLRRATEAARDSQTNPTQTSTSQQNNAQEHQPTPDDLRRATEAARDQQKQCTDQQIRGLLGIKAPGAPNPPKPSEEPPAEQPGMMTRSKSKSAMSTSGSTISTSAIISGKVAASKKPKIGLEDESTASTSPPPSVGSGDSTEEHQSQSEMKDDDYRKSEQVLDLHDDPMDVEPEPKKADSEKQVDKGSGSSCTEQEQKLLEVTKKIPLQLENKKAKYLSDFDKNYLKRQLKKDDESTKTFAQVEELKVQIVRMRYNCVQRRKRTPDPVTSEVSR